MTDKEMANEVQQAVARLNAALMTCYDAGLRSEVSTQGISREFCEDERSVIGVKLMRPIALIAPEG